MKFLLRLIILAVLGAAAYLFLVPGASVSDFEKYVPAGLKSTLGIKDSTENPAPVADSTTGNGAQIAAAPTPAPTSTPRPLETIRLKNGKSLIGNVVIRDADTTVIRTADGKSTQVPTKDIVTNP